jgi:tRNA (cytidine/uridine-2'-O-)-methyltransferase
MAFMRLALFEPDIAQNAGTIMRLAACLGLAVDLIEPCGFIVGDAKFRRSAMDYLDRLDLTRHSSWDAFQRARLARARPGRLVLLTTKAATRYIDAGFAPDDTLMVGRESAGVPDAVHEAADLRLVVPMQPGLRSINVALAAAMVVGEALRQTHLFAEGLPA